MFVTDGFVGVFFSDLAARNCLVFPDLSVKIGDYGISRCVYKVCEHLLCQGLLNSPFLAQ